MTPCTHTISQSCVRHLRESHSSVRRIFRLLSLVVYIDAETMRRIILRSGFESLARIAREIFPLLAIYPGKLLSDPTLDTGSIVQQSHKPLLIIHGHKDQTVPFSHAVDVARQACEPKRILELPACGHNDLCAVALPEFSTSLSLITSAGSMTKSASPLASQRPKVNLATSTFSQ